MVTFRSRNCNRDSLSERSIAGTTALESPEREKSREISPQKCASAGDKSRGLIVCPMSQSERIVSPPTPSSSADPSSIADRLSVEDPEMESPPTIVASGSQPPTSVASQVASASIVRSRLAAECVACCVESRSSRWGSEATVGFTSVASCSASGWSSGGSYLGFLSAIERSDQRWRR